MNRWPPSDADPYIRGHPPSITVTPCSRPDTTADADTLPGPKERCIHTSVMPRSTASRIVPSAYAALVAITTASTPPGTERRSG